MPHPRKTPTHKPLHDQVIVITGASSGIGLATARMAAARGARVVLAARNAEALAEIALGIVAKGGRALAVTTDVSHRSEVERLAQAAITEYGGFDTWVNNAGVSIYGRLEEVSDADHRQLFEVNFWGIVYGTTVAAAHLKTRGGAIVNLGSVASDVAFPIQGMYAASKHAIRGFTDAFRMEQEMVGAPITVSLIKPTSINTPLPSRTRNYMAGKPTLPPPVYAPEDVAEAILQAACHGGRDYPVGGAARVLSAVARHAPRLSDWMGATLIPGQSERREPAETDNRETLYSGGRDGEVHGRNGRIEVPSLFDRAARNPVAAGALIAGIGLAATVLGRRRS